MSGPNFVTTNAKAGDVDPVTKEARKKKIRELEASLFGSENNADLLWNPRYALYFSRSACRNMIPCGQLVETVFCLFIVSELTFLSFKRLESIPTSMAMLRKEISLQIKPETQLVI